MSIFNIACLHDCNVNISVKDITSGHVSLEEGYSKNTRLISSKQNTLNLK